MASGVGEAPEGKERGERETDTEREREREKKRCKRSDEFGWNESREGGGAWRARCAWKKGKLAGRRCHDAPVQVDQAPP